MHGFVAGDHFKGVNQLFVAAGIVAFQVKAIHGFINNEIVAAIRRSGVGSQRRGFFQIEKFTAGSPDNGVAYIFHAVKLLPPHYHFITAALSF